LASAPLSKRQLAVLKRRIAEMDDPTRYVIVSGFSRRFCLYYDPASGNFAMNHFPPACFFKHRAEAEAVAKVLGSRGRKKHRDDLQIIAVRKTPKSLRFFEQVRDRWRKGIKWKPILKRDALKAP
jgi:hypothetical protein